ncbi:hypothetical protein SKAU_G00095270 [Synaphobranchus kaupii]|uniref:Uncharacterized protein n=1 Tax=Synaphobranchus kaupii TaxID=118154 RepID=A0A9Q1J6K8_SYNKA|nr:hypothetical protein SKAU_G00095270 [Synaphobranchus kaupii]
MIHRAELDTFDQVRQEALSVDGDRQATVWQPPSSAAVAAGYVNPVSMGADWKEELKTELLHEVWFQMKEMQKALLEELQLSQPTPRVVLHEHPPIDPRQPKGMCKHLQAFPRKAVLLLAADAKPPGFSGTNRGVPSATSVNKAAMLQDTALGISCR